MSEFVRIGGYGDFREGKGRAVEVGGKKVAVFKLRGELFAISDACPHMGASLADGKLDGTKVICHWHDWSFDLHSGRTKEREWACANVYAVERRGRRRLGQTPATATAETRTRGRTLGRLRSGQAPQEETLERSADGKAGAGKADQQPDRDDTQGEIGGQRLRRDPVQQCNGTGSRLDARKLFISKPLYLLIIQKCSISVT